jgi:hypothetical protein
LSIELQDLISIHLFYALMAASALPQILRLLPGSGVDPSYNYDEVRPLREWLWGIALIAAVGILFSIGHPRSFLYSALGWDKFFKYNVLIWLLAYVLAAMVFFRLARRLAIRAGYVATWNKAAAKGEIIALIVLCPVVVVGSLFATGITSFVLVVLAVFLWTVYAKFIRRIRAALGVFSLVVLLNYASIHQDVIRKIIQL